MIEPSGSITVYSDDSVGDYDGGDDTLVGVVNNSGTTVSAITVTGPGSDLGGFDGDGICSYISCSWPAPTGYEGPMNTFKTDSSNPDVAEVDFTGGLATGSQTYFGLEGTLTSAVISARQGTLHADRWMALGDSYSAGVGGGLVPDNAACRTEPNASYAGQARENAMNAGHAFDFEFHACIGALTKDITSRSQPGTGQTPQVDYVKQSLPDIVTLTIGGNDIGFANTVKGCVVNSFVPLLNKCMVNGDKIKLIDQQAGERSGWDGLYDRLVKTYVEVRNAQPSNGELYVLTYPIFFANPATTWSISDLLFGCSGFNTVQAAQVNADDVRLGDTIFLAVQAANAQVGHVHFVDWRTSVTTQRITGQVQRVAYDAHGLCGGPIAQRDMNGVVVPIAPYSISDSFHPTLNGYANGATALWDQLKNFPWQN